MHDSIFLSQIVILFGTAVVVSWLFRVARAPAIIGFLFTGIIIGPSSLHLIDHESVEQFAEIGLILLLFTVGLELSPAPLLRMGRRVLTATGLQMTGVGVIGAAVASVFLDVSLGAAALIGLAVALSSTAISLKQLSDRGEIATAMGGVTTGLLLLQDVVVIAVMVVLPLFGAVASEGEHGRGPGFALIGAVGLVVAVTGGKRVMPRVIDQVISRGGNELATLFAVMMAGGGAWLATLAGWSPALGACVAGLLLAGADVRHQLVAEISPFRDVFNALFFISMGMLVSIDLALEHAAIILVAVAATIVLKTAITAAAVRAAGWPIRIAAQVGVGMCTVSEFAYVLLYQAQDSGVIRPELVQGIMAYIVGTMMAGAFVFPVGLAFVGRRMLGVSPESDGAAEGKGEGDGLDEHVIVVGYGVNGHNLARVLTSTHIPFCIIEMNQGLSREALATGAQVIVGDATRAIILHHAGLRRARAMVIGINDPLATRRIVSIARAAAPGLHIVVRTPNVAELEELTRRGADVVVPADFEASVKIFSHLLEELGVPRNILGAQIAAVRAGGYGVFRGLSSGSQESLEDLLKALNLAATQTFFLPDSSGAVGQSLKELDLRNRTGVSIIAVVRDRNPVTSLDGDYRLAANDVLVLVGSHAQLIEARKLLDASTKFSPTPAPDTPPEG